MPEQKHLYDVNQYPKERTSTPQALSSLPPASVMTATPDSGVTLTDSKSNLAPTKSESSSPSPPPTNPADPEKLPSVLSPPSFPEGGIQAWLTVLGG